ncbi:TRAP transporter large permease [Castellaniella sp.]|uniref:TRAP transporter large permease n=1 Tax=Castellaniella sp. TaxID=1955812 RepID=UPI003566F2A3
MSNILLLEIATLVLLLMLMTGAPVALGLLVSGIVGLVLSSGLDITSTTLGALPYQATAKIALVVIPMFLLMGIAAEKARIAEDMFRIADRLFRKIPGGLGVATIAACAAFGAVSGSSVAAASTIGRVSIHEMIKYRYSTELASGIVAVAGTLSVMIPPSIILVLYGIMAEESIGSLLIAGIVPGVVSAIILAVGVMVIARFTRHAGTPEPAAATASSASTIATPIAAATTDVEAAAAAVAATTAAATASTAAAASPGAGAQPQRSPWVGAIEGMLLFLVVVGGIYTGIVTVNEAAAVGALAGMVILALELTRLPARDVWRKAAGAFAETTATTSFIFAILVGASVFTYFLVSIDIPSQFAEWVAALPLDPKVIVGLLLLAMIPLGMFLDPVSILLIIVPLAHPVIKALGFSGIWFGILLVQMIEIGLVTPPVGLNVFVVAGTPGVTLEKAFKGIFLLLPLQIIAVLLFFAFPEIVLWLPQHMH